MTEPAGPHIVVVEDHQDSRETMCEVLESHGFCASAAMTADAAMAIVNAGGVAAIVTDIVLKAGDGDGVWLLHQVGPRGIPVIAVTGRAERRDELGRVGFADVLIKPIDMDTLVGALEAAIAKAT